MDVQNSKGDTDVKGRLLDSVEEGEGSMTWEQHWNAYITTCKRDDQRKFDAGSRRPGRVSVTAGRDEVEREAGGGLGRGEHMYT